MVAGILVALLVGVAVGVALARFFPEVADESTSNAEMTDLLSAASAAAPPEPDPATRALFEAADGLDLALVVCDSGGVVVYRNAASTELGTTLPGVIVGEHVDTALDAARAGERTDRRIDLHGPPRLSLELVAEPLASGGAAAIVNDVSERTRLDAMRTDFVANISHELKTPVGAIAVLAEALEGAHDAETVDRVSHRLVLEAHRAVTAIDDLLELSTIESSRVSDDVVSLDDVISAACERGRSVDAAKGVTITPFAMSPSLALRGDRRQLVSAIGNLVENAVKYSDTDGVVQVRTRVDDRHIEIMVTDQGDGIPQRDLDRIFERFYRVDRARSRSTGGTGLGLAIVRHVASNHGGRVVVSSQEGEGSTFVLQLPGSLAVDPASAIDTAAVGSTVALEDSL